MELKFSARFKWLSSFAATFTFISMANLCHAQQWDGDHSVGNFSAPENWYGNNLPSWSSGSDLEFRYNNNSQTSTYYDLSQWNAVQSIYYYNTYFYNNGDHSVRGMMTLDGNGNGLDFHWKIENQSADAQRIRIPLSFKGTTLELNPVSADLVLDNNHPLYNQENKNYNVWGYHRLLLGNVPHGNASTKLVLQRDEINNSTHYPYVEIETDLQNHTEAFGGGVLIKAGELWFNEGGSIRGGGIQVGNSDYTAKVFLNDKDGGQTIYNNIEVPTGSNKSHIGGLNLSGTNTWAGVVTLHATAFLEAWAGGTVNFSGDINGAGGVIIQKVNGSGTTVVQYSGTAKSYTGATTIKNNAALKISGDQTLGDVSLEAGGTLIIDNGATLTLTGTWVGGGTLINNGTIILQGPSDFPGTGTTVSAMNHLTLNKTGATRLDQSISITGAYNPLKGILNIGNNNLMLENSAVIGGNVPGVTNMIQADGSGKVIKNFTTAATFTFPIGDNTSGADYSPVTITINSLAASASVGINVADSKHPNNPSPANYITRYWTVSSTGTLNIDAIFTYTQDDVTGQETSLLKAGWNGTNWNLYGNANSADNALSVAGQSDFDRAFTAGDQFSLLASLPGDYFRSSQAGNWNVANNWQSSPDEVNWIPSTLIPDKNAKGITICKDHTITLTAAASARKLKIESGAVLDNTNSSGGYPLTIAPSGGAVIDFEIYGTYILYGTQPVFESGAQASVYGGGIVRADNNNAPGESDDFARSNKISWQTGSVFDWHTTSAFETSNKIYFPNAGNNDIAKFRISKTIGGTFGGGADLTINGLFEINADNTLSGGGNKIFRNGICGNSTLSQDGSISDPGNFQITGSIAILGGRGLTLNLTDIINLKSDVEVPVDSLVVFIKGTGIATSGSISKGTGVIFTVNGTADMGIINTNNTTGHVSINGTLRTASTEGLTGNSNATITSGQINMNAGSTVEYYAAVDQKVSTTSQLDNNKYYHLILSGDRTKSPFNNNPIIIDDNGSVTISGPSSLIIDASLNNLGPSSSTNATAFIMDGGRLKLGTLGFTGSGTLPAMKGTYTLTGGTVEFLGGTSSTSQSVRSGSLYNYYNIEVSGPYVKTSGGNVNIGDGGSFIINPGGIFTINVNSITSTNTSGASSVCVKSGGIFNSANVGGFNGRAPAGIGDTTSSVHANITNIQLDPGSTVNYSRDNSLAGDGSQPITNANGIQYQNLVLSGTGNKIAVPGTFIIKGNFSKTTASVFVHNNGNVEFNNNSSPQTITSVAPYPVFYDIINNNLNSLNIGTATSGIHDSMYIQRSLTLSNSSRLLLDADVTMLSGDDSTAFISEIPDGPAGAKISYGNGRFVVERKIPLHAKAWQLLSVPTEGATIQSSWQMPKGASTPFWGTKITTPGANWLADGFDGQSFAPSMKYYDPASDAFVGVSKTSDPISSHTAYFLFVRGDRTVAYNESTTTVMLQTRGKIYSPENPPASATVLPGKWSLLGNPYAAAIDFGKLITTGGPLEDGYYIWDPKLTTSGFSNYGLGGYRRIISDGGGYTAIPPDDAYEDGEYPVIQSGQGFFVQSAVTATENTVINFSEAAKVKGGVNVFRTGQRGTKPGKLRINLSIDADDQKTLMDGALQLFGNDFSAGIDQYDARKMMNGTENISLPSLPYPLIVERRPWPNEGDTLFYHLSNTGKKKYVIDIIADNMPFKSQEIYFHDHYLGISKQLHEGKNTISFSIDDKIQSAAKNRFFLTFKNIPTFYFDNVDAVVMDGLIRLSWSGINQHLVSSYTLESAQDTIHFTVLHQVDASTSHSDRYQFNHQQPKPGKNYYRLKASMKDGSAVYSDRVVSEIVSRDPAIALYPNPAPRWLHLNLKYQPEGKYSVTLTSVEGKKVFSKILYHRQSATYQLNIEKAAAGIYYFDLQGPGNKRFRKKIVVIK